MKIRNEQTSKRVASKAGKLMRDIDKAFSSLQAVARVLADAKAVVASALTQAPAKARKKTKRKE